MNIYHFSLDLANKEISSIYDHQQSKGIHTFYHPLTSSDYKIYILSNKEGILYVGTAKTSIRSRLKFGLKANGKKGYHGYKWKEEKEVDLHVIILDGYNQQKAEAVEAEIAFWVRQKTGQWPQAQNEIHFNNEFSEASQIAETIMKKILDDPQ